MTGDSDVVEGVIVMIVLVEWNYDGRNGLVMW